MNYQKVIDYKLHILIDIMLTEGVSPSELSDNIFEKEYISIIFKKEHNNILGILKFYENHNSIELVEMIYTYTKEKKLIKIEEVNNGVVEVLWDRNKREEELLQEILFFLERLYNNEQLEKFITNLPIQLRDKINEYILNIGA